MSKKDFKAKIAKKKARSLKKAAQPKDAKKNFWQKLSQEKKHIITFCAICAVLIAAIVLAIVLWGGGDKKKADATKVEISADFSHEVPEGLDVNDIITMKNETTAKKYLRNYGYYSNLDPIPYEKGWYLFDNDGVARKYRDADGNIQDLPLAEQVENLEVIVNGVPLQIVGEVKMHFIVYRGEGVAQTCYQYYTLSDKTDMEFLMMALDACGAVNAKQVSETVVEVVLDRQQIVDLMDEFKLEDTLTDFMTYLGKIYEVAQ